MIKTKINKTIGQNSLDITDRHYEIDITEKLQIK